MHNAINQRNIVAKFGGTSVQTAPAIQRIAEIIKLNPEIQVVVVSAVSGVTNLLVEFCNSSSDKRRSLIQQILDIHLKLAHELDLSIQNNIKEIFLRLDHLSELNILTKETRDQILSLGEDLSSLIVHAYLSLQGLNITYVDIRNYLITDDHFGKATPDLAMIKNHAEQFPSGLCITQGFIGRTSDGRTTTLGRGGSDYSAALIAEALNIDELHIYTDVPGVYTMDPNIVPTAHLIPELNFQEMAEMANFGAKILHPATLEPCVRAQIPVRILSSFEPHRPGTTINIKEPKNVDPNTSTISAITMRKGQVLVTIKSLKMLNAYGFLANIFSILARHKISVDLITTSEVSVALTIDGTNTGSHSLNPFIANKELFDELQEFSEVTIEEDLTLLAVVGSGLTIPGIIQKTLGILEPYMIRLVCYGASNSSISILVQKENATHMAQMLHQQLLGDTRT